MKIKHRLWFGFLLGIVLSGLFAYFLFETVHYTSTNEYCASCHVHPHATDSWEEGVHYKTASGVIADCVDCHLPPEGMERYIEKARAGIRDVYGYYFKDISQIDWEARSTLEYARTFTFDSACTNCHAELFPIGLSEKAVDAHLHYRKNKEELRCINCHLTVGHFHEEPASPPEPVGDELFTDEGPGNPLITELGPDDFTDYVEVIPETDVRFEMVAVEGGSFLMGSPESQPLRDADEGPQRGVKISPFWIGKFEVTWREYDTFYTQTATYGKEATREDADAIAGPTPPYGSPDQGWGKGLRPAITMTHYAAQVYCRWLSDVTGRNYRLPTEAEWEYACRAGTMTAYFFDGVSEAWLDQWLGKLLGRVSINEERLKQYAWYRENSGMRTHPPGEKEANPWGLHNMIGNVKEFCQDWYSPTTYEMYPANDVVMDPSGPQQGEEHVIRGGSFKSGTAQLRSAERDHTRHDAWLKTDPQTPKSKWWYSDSNDVGFRVVREFKGREN